MKLYICFIKSFVHHCDSSHKVKSLTLFLIYYFQVDEGMAVEFLMETLQTFDQITAEDQQINGQEG